MTLDVTFFRDFYNTRLGLYTALDVLLGIRRMNPSWGGKTLFFGYGLPLFAQFPESEKQMIWAMPARQGIVLWPANHHTRAVLVEDNQMPFADETFDNIVCLHSLEFAQDPEDFLQEIVRVATRGATMTLIVPNRLGLWAHRDKTPFGYGNPYTLSQLTHLLQRCSLTITRKTPVLSFFPCASRWGNHPFWSRLWPQALTGAWCVRVERDPVWAVVAPKPLFVIPKRPALSVVPQSSARQGGPHGIANDH